MHLEKFQSFVEDELEETKAVGSPLSGWGYCSNTGGSSGHRKKYQRYLGGKIWQDCKGIRCKYWLKCLPNMPSCILLSFTEIGNTKRMDLKEGDPDFNLPSQLTDSHLQLSATPAPATQKCTHETFTWLHICI
jgi:hypothetical protein